MGSFWLEAEVIDSSGVVTARTPGLADNDHQGLQPAVFRLTMRKDDSFLGVLTGFMNVPGLFGSVTRQSRNYIGVDCADVLVSAWRELRGQYIERNVNVAHLVTEWPKIGTTNIESGVPDTPLKWGEDVRPGDLVAVRYAGSRQFGHVGAAYSDHDGDGILGPGDLILHVGPQPLHFSRLSDGGFDGEVVLLRPKGVD